MAAAIPLAVREKIVSAYARELGSQSELAEMFDLHERTVRRFIHKDRKGNLKPKRRTGRLPMIGVSELKKIESMVELDPDKTLSEYCIIFKENSGIFVSVPVMCKTLKKLNLRRKKKSFYAQEQERPDVKKKTRFYRYS
jgi:transposase